MTNYNPTQEVQKTCLEIARRVTSVKNFIEFLEREGRFVNSTFVSKDYEDFQTNTADTLAKALNYDSFVFGIPLLNFPYQDQLQKLAWWNEFRRLIAHQLVNNGQYHYWSRVDTGKTMPNIVSFNVLYRASGLFEVVEKEHFDLPEDYPEYKNVTTGKRASDYQIHCMMEIFKNDVHGLVSMGLLEALPPAQGTRYHYAPNFKKLNELIELHNTLSPLVFECPVVLEKF